MLLFSKITFTPKEKKKRKKRRESQRLAVRDKMQGCPKKPNITETITFDIIFLGHSFQPCIFPKVGFVGRTANFGFLFLFSSCKYFLTVNICIVMAPGKCKPEVLRKAFSCRGLPKALPMYRQNSTGSVRHERR